MMMTTMMVAVRHKKKVHSQNRNHAFLQPKSALFQFLRHSQMHFFHEESIHLALQFLICHCAVCLPPPPPMYYMVARSNWEFNSWFSNKHCRTKDKYFAQDAHIHGTICLFVFIGRIHLALINLLLSCWNHDFFTSCSDLWNASAVHLNIFLL